MLQPGTGHRTWQRVSCQDSTASNPERKRLFLLQTEGARHSSRTGISCLPIWESHYPSRRSSPSHPHYSLHTSLVRPQRQNDILLNGRHPCYHRGSTHSDRLPARGTDQAPDRKTVASLSPHNQNQPHRTFLVHQNPRRPLLHPQPDRRGLGSPQRRTTSRPSLAGYRTRRRRKTHKPRGHRLQNQSVLNLFKQLRLFFTRVPGARNGEAISSAFFHYLYLGTSRPPPAGKSSYYSKSKTNGLTRVPTSRFIYISNSVSLKLVATQTPNLPKNHLYYLREIIWT